MIPWRPPLKQLKTEITKQCDHVIGYDSYSGDIWFRKLSEGYEDYGCSHSLTLFDYCPYCGIRLKQQVSIKENIKS